MNKFTSTDKSDTAGHDEPAFLADDVSVQDVPEHVHTANASELFGLRNGETVAQAAARKAAED